MFNELDTRGSGADDDGAVDALVCELLHPLAHRAPASTNANRPGRTFPSCENRIALISIVVRCHRRHARKRPSDR